MRRILAVFLCLLLCTAIPAALTEEIATASEPLEEPEDIAGDRIEEALLYYGFRGSSSRDRIRELMAEAAELEPERAEVWKRILNYWQYVTEKDIIVYNKPVYKPEKGEKLAIVVLGYRLHPDGSIDPELEGRLRVALTCAQTYPDAVIVCTGGGTASRAPECTEAGQMAAWLVKHGVDRERILIEDQSLTTTQNAVYSERLLREAYPETGSVLIVTSDYHIRNGCLLFQSVFLLREAEGEASVRVVSNAAYRPTEKKYHPRRYETGGLLLLLGREEDADRVLDGEEPNLK